ncbi:MAG: amidohydrolase family protein [Actinomycetota bacterium]|nr:amidohydrolase family protein [Actinomycetota bacterium]
MRLRLLLVLSLLALTACSPSGDAGTVPAMGSEVIAIEGATALLGAELTPTKNVTIVVEGGTITQIGSNGRTDVPPGAHLVDATGVTVLPGFIDAHVHIGFYPPEQVLGNGVTTVRDLAWPPERIFPMVEASRQPDYNGPSIHAAGPMITVPGGYPLTAGWAPEGTGVGVTTADEARRAVDDTIEQGATVVKVALNPPAGPTLPRELLEAVVEAAHAHGSKVTAHIYGLDELQKAVDAGVDELAHMLMSREKIPDPLLSRMVNEDVAIVPTLSVRYGRDKRIATDNLRRFVEAGGRVVYGTDLGNAGPRPGIDPREVKAMAKAGMTPLDIIRSATVGSAAWLGLDDVGALVVGMNADIVGLRGDPTTDVGALTDVAFVVRRTTVVDSR